MASVNRLHRAADRYEGRFKSVLNRAVREGRAAVKLSRSTQAFARRDRASIEREAQMGLSTMEKQLASTVEGPMMACLMAGATVAANTLRRDARNVKVARAASPKLTFRFDRTNPASVAWVKQHGAELVTEVSESTRRAIRKVIERAFTENLPPRTAAKLLQKVVGLTESSEEAVAKLRATIQASPGKVVYAGKVRIRVPERGMSTGRLDTITDRYADRLLRHRTLLIARTETIRASNEGQTKLWQEAVQQGQLPRNVQRVWIVTPDERLCPICEPLEGERASLNGTFQGQFQGPPAHPACRCTTGLA